MADYAIPFSDKLLDDEAFDTIFGGQEDDELMGSVMKESDEFNDDVRDTSELYPCFPHGKAVPCAILYKRE